LAFPPIRKRGRSGSLSRNAAPTTAPSYGATQTGGVAASEVGTRRLSQRVSAASPRESATVARPARREARVPAGQPKGSAPSRSAAGKSATLETPAHLQRACKARPCASDHNRQAETPMEARWRKPARAGLRNRARCGLARRCQISTQHHRFLRIHGCL
jgi:hypothetical protein